MLQIVYIYTTFPAFGFYFKVAASLSLIFKKVTVLYYFCRYLAGQPGSVVV